RSAASNSSLRGGTARPPRSSGDGGGTAAGEGPTGARPRANRLRGMTAASTSASAARLMPYDDVIARFDPVLGMEVHVELGTATKMFCGCPTEFGAAPNTQVCPVCLALPGALPVVNDKAVEMAIRIGLALNCSITPWGR